MIKKSTLFVLLGAMILGGVVYYFDWKKSAEETAPPDKTKPVFTMQAADVASLMLTRPAKPDESPIHFERNGEAWKIVQPVQTQADSSSVDGIVDGIASARSDQTEPGTPDRLKAFGLDPAQLSIEFQLKKGAKHTLLLGNKDFSGSSVYAVADGSKDVVLLPESLLTSSDKSLNDLRDRSLLSVTNTDVASFDLKNASGEWAAIRGKDGWTFTRPAGQRGDGTAIDSFLSALTTGKMAAIASETPDSLGKYGLGNPAITFTVTDAKGSKSTLLIGKKDGDEYFARDASRPVIFRISGDLYKKLAGNYEDLRDKQIVHFQADDVSRIEVHNKSGTIILNRKSQDDWAIEAPADQKGKSAGPWKFLTPVTDAKAEQIFDHPSPDIAARLAKPVVEAIFTTKDGRKLTVSFSAEAGEFVYARTSEGPAVYKLKKAILDDLNSTASQIQL